MNQKTIEICKNGGSLIEILEKLGYEFTKRSNYYLSKAIYRDGESPRSLVIYPKQNKFVDYVTGEKGTLQKLVSLTLNIPINKVSKVLSENNEILGYENPVYTKTLIHMPETYPISILNELFPIHNYWIDRGISEETLKEFRGGIAEKGKMQGRYVLPIFNENASLIVGFIGRDTLNFKKTERPKYKTLGSKNNFKWPLFLNKSILINKKEIILVESSHCVMKLWDDGIKNTLCIFGTDISFELINEILKLDPNKIIISLNNELNNKSIGNIASEKVYKKLSKYFDPNQLEIFLPFKKDFGEQTTEENKQWYKELQEKLYEN